MFLIAKIMYSIGGAAAIARLISINRSHLALRRLDKMLLFIVFTIPLGKLIYFHFPELIGVKFSFIALNIYLLIALAGFINMKTRASKRALFYIILISCPVFFSLLQVGDLGSWFVYTKDNQADSLIFRAFAFLELVIFSLLVAKHLQLHGYRMIVTEFVMGLYVSTVIGCLIFVLVFLGILTAEDLLPISADTHIVGLVYRFNPGGNVNEYGILAVYGLSLLRCIRLKSTIVRLSAAPLIYFGLFFSLTRAAWLAFLIGIISAALIGRDQREVLFKSMLVFTAMVLFLYTVNDDFQFLVESRFAMVAGASGEERLEKLDHAMQQFTEGPESIFMGTGWGTQLYLHSVPFQLLVETGMLGFLVFLVAFLVYPACCFIKNRSFISKTDRAIVVQLTTSAISFSFFHHILYHMQTWFVFGICLSLTRSFFPLQYTYRSKASMESE